MKTDLDSIKARVALQDRMAKLVSELDELAEKTGIEATKLGTKLKFDLTSIVKVITSIDVKDEIYNIIAKIDTLVDQTGDAAKKLANEIKADINNILKKI
ncbi:MAG: hypothetical protein K0A89_08900 [ANME-2 cluster archaeon]|nr:hypothetical protein [ANME-2 cluster archaeon]